MNTTPALTIVRSARKGAATDHLAFNTGWSATPLCGAMKTGKRVFPGGDTNCTPCIAEANRQYLDIEGLVRISPRVRDLIAAVRAHAIENYNTGAWDIIVEAYSDSELAGTVGKCRTAAGAIAKVAKVVEQYAARRAPHDAEIRMATETTVFTDPAQPEPDAPATETDGSVVTAHHAPDDELLSLTRTWPGRRGHAEIDLWTNVETYHPGWRGQIVESPNLCGHDVPEGQLCQSNDCRRAACCPF